MNISDEAVEAALRGALPTIYENLTLPYGASIQDYPDRDDLRAADEAAEEANNDILRQILRAALDAAAPYIINEARADAWDEGVMHSETGQSAESNPYRSQA
jgi:TPP-dependent pyruvate/acetoin dehydrogenase alpha subunit